MNNRFWEIDLLRGLAILMMVIYHFVWDLLYFGYLNFDISDGFWRIFQILTASLFIFLVGVSSHLSYERGDVFKKFLFRGLKVFSFGLLITFVSWIFFPNEFIVFGILHFIGLSVIISYFFLRFKYLNLIFGVLIIFVGSILKNFIFDSIFLLPLGIVSSSFSSLDYFPIFPWFGIVLFGSFWAKLFYKKSKRLFPFSLENINYFTRSLTFIGKHSLIIYLIHQPVLFLYFLLIQL